MKTTKGEKVFMIVTALIGIWFVFSFVDTIVHNNTDYEYSRLNMFTWVHIEAKKEPILEYEPLSEKVENHLEQYVKDNIPEIEEDMQEIEKPSIESNVFYEEEDDDWVDPFEYNTEILARVINGEAGAEYVSDETRYYVGSVVLNRVESEYYPNTIEEVVFQRGQYECTWNGMYDRQPTEACYRIARDLLINGSKLPNNVLLQANFVQGDSIYAYMDTIYFCTWGQ